MNFNEWTNTLLYKNIYLSHLILERVDVSVVCERWVERHILRERTSSSHIFFQEPWGANACTPWQACQRRLWSAACPSVDCLVGLQLLNIMVEPPTSTVCLHGPMSTFQLTLFQNLQILRTIASRHDVIHTPAHFLSGVYYDNCDCHILCERA